MTFRRLLVLSLTGLLVLALPGVAPAHDHRVPLALLRIHGFPQRGRVISADWVARREAGCVEKERRKEMRFGPPVRVNIGLYPGRLRLLTRHRPRLRILSWILLDGEKRPVGSPEEIPFELEPLARNGRTLAWDAVFDLTVLEHRYIAVFARWPDRENCDQMQRVTWTYHIRGL